MLKAERAEYSCPAPPPGMDTTYRHLAAYMRSLPAAAFEPDTAELAQVLWAYTGAFSASSYMELVQQFMAVAARLAEPDCKRRLQRQLEQLASSHGQQEQLLTVEQLQYVCWVALGRVAGEVLKPSAEQLAELHTAAMCSVQAMRCLEPTSHAAVAAALLLNQDRQWLRQAVQCFLRVSELGQQQRSDYWTAHGAGNALIFAAAHPLEVGHSAVAAALAAFEQTAEAALRRCKRLLPEQWVQDLRCRFQLARPMLAGARDQLPLLLQQQASSSSSSAASSALLASAAAQKAAVGEHAASLGPTVYTTECSGCGQEAVGLRRCSRCKKAQYCRCVAPCALQQCLQHLCYPAVCAA